MLRNTFAVPMLQQISGGGLFGLLRLCRASLCLHRFECQRVYPPVTSIDVCSAVYHAFDFRISYILNVEVGFHTSHKFEACLLPLCACELHSSSGRSCNRLLVKFYRVGEGRPRGVKFDLDGYRTIPSYFYALWFLLCILLFHLSQRQVSVMLNIVKVRGICCRGSICN